MKETLKLLDRSPANILIFNAMAAMIPDDSDMLKAPDFEGVQTPDGFWPAYDFVTQTKSGMTDESFFSCSC